MRSDPLIWLDLEMTGLNTQTDYILEIATVITDNQLNVIAEGPALAIHHDESHLAVMDEWNRRQHSQSGLLDRVRASTLDEQVAELRTLEFLRRHLPKGVSPLCGNSICQDRRFLARCMPELESYFHYRHLDVSTVKELAWRWYGIKPPSKSSRHRALDDIYDSIEELRYYRTHLFVPMATSK